jgi:hypothetical protein
MCISVSTLNQTASKKQVGSLLERRRIPQAQRNPQILPNSPIQTG